MKIWVIQRRIKTPEGTPRQPMPIYAVRDSEEAARQYLTTMMFGCEVKDTGFGDLSVENSGYIFTATTWHTDG